MGAVGRILGAETNILPDAPVLMLGGARIVRFATLTQAARHFLSCVAGELDFSRRIS